jgi:hypothetical protein
MRGPRRQAAYSQHMMHDEMIWDLGFTRHMMNMMRQWGSRRHLKTDEPPVASKGL